MVKCEICKIDFDCEDALCGHIKSHNISRIEYYQTHRKRFDLYDGSIIKFRTRDQYLSDDFNSRLNMVKWLIKQPDSIAKKFAIKVLKERVEEKKLKYAPSFIETKTLIMPSPYFYDKIFKEGYDGVCESLGLELRFKRRREKLPVFDCFPPLVQIDTREKKPIEIPENKVQEVIKRKLDFGDYLFTNLSENRVFFERKSLIDFVGTMSKGYERFQAEIERAAKQNRYLVVLIESAFKDSMNFDRIRRQLPKRVKANPEFIFHRVRELMQKYNNIQFIFTSGRKKMFRVMLEIYYSNNGYKQIDLQDYFHKR